MDQHERLSFDLEQLPVDVFDMTEAGLAIESLTAGHGMPEAGASCSLTLPCLGTNCGSCSPF